jgi:effector-binding domain-containing protein
MLGEPGVEQRDEQPCVAIRSTVPMRELPTVIPRDIGAVLEWTGRNGVAPAGPPFVRYRVVEMERELDVEVGVPVAGAVAGEDGVEAGLLPAGRYATAVHVGTYDRLVDAHAALQAWATEQGLDLARGPAGFEVQLESYLTDPGFEVQLESYLTDPANEPDFSKHETEVAYLLAG